jgi:hypothetical protein
MTKKRWMKVVERPRPAKPMDAEKAAIIAACEAFIHDFQQAPAAVTCSASNGGVRTCQCCGKL